MDWISDWLEKLTGCDSAWWVAAVQNECAKTLTKGDDPNHDEADPVAFIRGVLGLVSQTLKDDGQYDGNMRNAAVMSLVLGLWYSRLAYAKSHDPNRPGLLRRRAYAKWLEWVNAMQLLPLDERHDSTYFSGQKWDFPFSFETQDGDFK